eukprot:766210-Hanusia_phi.AAC.6
MCPCRHLREKLDEIEELLVKKKRGDALDVYQLNKIGTRKMREEEMEKLQSLRRECLMNASESTCDQFGACNNCGVEGHRTKDCPRPLRKKRPDTDKPGQRTKSGNLGRGTKSKEERRETSKSGKDIHPPAPQLDQAWQEGAEDEQGCPRVLCIAEKPSVANTVANILSNGKKRSRSNPAGYAPMCRSHEFFYHFHPAKTKSHVTFTSVIGHVEALDFDEDTGNDPRNLFGARVKKVFESSVKEEGVDKHLLSLAEGRDYLFLWLDCDREGENICFEILRLFRSHGFFLADDAVYRAHFSALSSESLKKSFASPGKPNEQEAKAVDARQEMDLKVGVAFTRCLTRKFLEGARRKFKDEKLKVLSFGPCQTPTLFFCVQREEEIRRFVSRKFWRIQVQVELEGSRSGRVDLKWMRGSTFDRNQALHALRCCQQASHARLLRIERKEKSVDPPLPLNTVALLQLASLQLGFSPAKTMAIAERLYTRGYISYPRTETSMFPPSFDPSSLLRQLVDGSQLGRFVQRMLEEGCASAPTRGIDRGDHVLLLSSSPPLTLSPSHPLTLSYSPPLLHSTAPRLPLCSSSSLFALHPTLLVFTATPRLRSSSDLLLLDALTPRVSLQHHD